MEYLRSSGAQRSALIRYGRPNEWPGYVEGVEEKVHIWQLCLSLMISECSHKINFSLEWFIVLQLNVFIKEQSFNTCLL